MKNPEDSVTPRSLSSLLPWEELDTAWVRRTQDGREVARVDKDPDDPMLDTENKASVDARWMRRITTSVPPTEPGWYLFFGAWTLSEARERLRELRPELVRVGHDANNRLIYLGRDIRSPTSETVGQWVSVDLEPSLIARESLVEAIASNEVHHALRYQGNAPLHRTWITEQVQSSARISAPLAHQIVDAAIRTGVLQKVSADRFRLTAKP